MSPDALRTGRETGGRGMRALVPTMVLLGGMAVAFAAAGLAVTGHPVTAAAAAALGVAAAALGVTALARR